MEITVGSVLTGKVTAIVKFGAFVELAPGKSGLVHISEIASTYVNDVSEHLSTGQEVQVKVVGTDGGKINLSIKQALPPPAPRERVQVQQPRPAAVNTETPDINSAFEDKLRRFMQDSNNKMSGARGYIEKKGKRRGK